LNLIKPVDIIGAIKVFASIAVIRGIVCALIALALLAAPLPIVNNVQAAAGMSMSAPVCQKQKSYCDIGCDIDNADCSKAQVCFAKYNGIAGLTAFDKAPCQITSGDSVFSIVSRSLTPHVSTPLRRPPRA